MGDVALDGFGAGGAALNFKVVPGLTQPGTAAENTIWVKTEKINNWYISAIQPEEMQEWDVWISAGTSSPVEFNALKKNGIQVYPNSVKQYVSGKLVDKTAKTYQGGKWVASCGMAGYQEVAYIQNTTTQYINTGITADYNTEVDCETAFSSAPIDNQYFGIIEDSNRLYLGYSQTSGYYHGYNAYYAPTTLTPTANNVWHKIHLETEQGTQSLSVDGKVVMTSNGTISTVLSDPYYLFAVNKDNTPAICPNTKFSRFQIKIDGVLVRDFVPCYRKSDSVAGMWDNVSSTFFGNAGTGTFIVGEDV